MLRFASSKSAISPLAWTVESNGIREEMTTKQLFFSEVLKKVCVVRTDRR